MNKRTTAQRKPKAELNTTIVKILKDKYGFTRNYVTMCIAGTRTGTIPLKIAEEYKMMEKAANAAIKETLNS